MNNIKKDFIKNGIGLIVVMSILYTTWASTVFWSFFRTVWQSLTTVVSDNSVYKYGFWYGSLWWGYGYWYGYWYSWANNYGNPVSVNFPNTYNVNSSQISVTIPAGTTMETSDWTPFDPSSIVIGSESTSSISLWTNETPVAAIKYGLPNKKLIFSNPIRIEIPITWYANGTTITVKVKHYWNTTFNTSGLTNDNNATCSNWIPSSWSAIATINN